MPNHAEFTSTERNRYFDLVRGLALVRVIVYHTLALNWLHVNLPVMGVMFALAGSLMSTSLAQRRGLRVVGTRVRRLLPPFWLFGVITLLVGLESFETDRPAWTSLPFWIVPLRDPSNLPNGSELVDTLWYLRTYLWFVLLAPLVWRLLRRAAWLVLPLPVFLLGALTTMAAVRWPADALTDLVGYGALFLLGFAEQRGTIRRLPHWLIALLVAALAGAGVALRFISGEPDLSIDGVATIGYFLYSAAIALVVMRLRPPMGWLRRVPWLDRALTIVNARAMTIYLWHDPAIAVVRMVVARLGFHPHGATELVLVFLSTAAAVLAFGWVEDLAAGRRLTMLRRIGTIRPRHVARHRLDTTPVPVPASPGHHRGEGVCAPETPSDEPISAGSGKRTTLRREERRTSSARRRGFADLHERSARSRQLPGPAGIVRWSSAK